MTLEYTCTLRTLAQTHILICTHNFFCILYEEVEDIKYTLFVRHGWLQILGI